jgi:radical SAM protein with 4Fe4S-binding SPASM domain
MRGIRKLVDNGMETRLMFTLQRSNRNDVSDIIDLAINEDIDGITIERLVPTGNAEGSDMLSPAEIYSVFQHISDRADASYRRENKLKILKYRPLWVLLDPCRARADANTPVHRDLGGMCSLGIDGIALMPDATVLGCRRLPISIGNLKQDSLEKIWMQSKLLWDVRDKNNLKGKCNSCKYIPRCGGCRSMAYACTGDYLAEVTNPDYALMQIDAINRESFLLTVCSKCHHCR